MKLLLFLSDTGSIFFALKEVVQQLKETKLLYWLELRKDLLEIMILANT